MRSQRLARYAWVAKHYFRHPSAGHIDPMHATAIPRGTTPRISTMHGVMDLVRISRALSRAASKLSFSEPVRYVYNPLEYARRPHEAYLSRYGKGPKEILLLGMNPGPFGMAQTGVPFGEVAHVREWLGIDEPVGKPPLEHPKRPILGFDCPRSEVSGRRLWSWAKGRFGTPAHFFERFFVHNFCPLVFMAESGKNLTPDKLPKAERDLLFEICDQALVRVIEELRPTVVVGIGGFAQKRAQLVLEAAEEPKVGVILHPSPASPKANRGWEPAAEADFARLGITLPS